MMYLASHLFLPCHIFKNLSINTGDSDLDVIAVLNQEKNNAYPPLIVTLPSLVKFGKSSPSYLLILLLITITRKRIAALCVCVCDGMPP